ncbi:hypothetical protein BDZ97DRAFT_1911480 [Flammula alnicola]|nr:hypothetical protein BDZ97DRAFT_1911480 [Flammula alnicola]
MSQTVTQFTAKLVEFDTTVPFAEVISRLDAEVNKAGSADITTTLKNVTSNKEFVSVVDKAAKKDFLYFSEFPHSKMLRFADGFDNRGIIAYTVGNPMIAKEILKYNPLAAYSIPPRILIIENPGGIGTSVSYHLPSAAMTLHDGEKHPYLQAVLESLDEKLERLVAKITAQ